jgi:hypothetical protein
MRQKQLHLHKRLLSLFLFTVISVECFGQSLSSNSQLSVIVNTSAELYAAINQANETGNIKIILQSGRYPIPQTLNILKPNISLVSATLDPLSTLLVGTGMRQTATVGNIIRVAAPYFILDGISLEQSSNHLIQIAGESNADFPILRNCILKDSYEQLVKVSYNRNTGIASDGGLVENCHFEYSAGIGPQYYIGGIDVHGGQDWIIRNNYFTGIASPARKIAEHAIHFWNGTQNIIVTDNVIYNCDRGIGFGMPNRPNFGGLIANNLIVHNDNIHPNADTGIILEESQGTRVIGNRIYLAHDYSNAIEYRFVETINVKIEDNITNKKITKRNGAQAILKQNILTADINQILTKKEQLKFGFTYQ